MSFNKQSLTSSENVFFGTERRSCFQHRPTNRVSNIRHTKQSERIEALIKQSNLENRA